ncbi:hypothetical protein BDK51DRAFT_47509 [Blyttiomyces helicus]|uniref:Alpha/beta hydrolase fold-3 domain-containing protein n=1 Tax=Blyttiomyces helicus TaxID=388810 RepID=A0A4P9W8A1_9FUNG|nr:hypothetical protein BDK51DRAFT_47509 [Blyttiomyces helicus]|eukprot:RKO87020.1 hypothetical protein BDK51DRAFT_47509 [Blyttiomyces helicus]
MKSPTPLPHPLSLVLISPWPELHVPAEFLHQRGEDYITPALGHEMASHYLGVDPCVSPLAFDPYASPGLGDFCGFAGPMLIMAGEREILLGAIERFVVRLRCQGVRVVYELEKGMPHVYGLLGDFFGGDVVKRAIGEVAAFVGPVLRADVEDMDNGPLCC